MLRLDDNGAAPCTMRDTYRAKHTVKDAEKAQGLCHGLSGESREFVKDSPSLQAFANCHQTATRIDPVLRLASATAHDDVHA
jgi:hypothetical protein